jgi:RimJ/RimL family protein N-acetyltransferase
MTQVDVWVLSRDGGPLDRLVHEALLSQRGVTIHVHRVAGESLPDDPCRWATIARARNFARRFGHQPWGIFLDDDVVLGADCVRQLVAGLRARPTLAALGANYLREPRTPFPSPHVAMGATLFRREALAAIQFRWERSRCECQCCCDDLRRLGWQIDYLPSAQAYHLAAQGSCGSRHGEGEGSATLRLSEAPRAERNAAPRFSFRERSRLTGRVLVAFDRRHMVPFRQRFLRSLRAWGNAEIVTVVGYGLYPSEQRVLAGLPGIEVVPLAVNGVMPPVRRLSDFQPLVASWPEETPVAYWDAGDVLFQSQLEPLWQQVAATPRALLAVSEPKGYPDNQAVSQWTLSIHDPRARHEAFQLLSSRPFLNSGFAAGTASAMLAYLREAERLRSSADLRGTSDWGDQTALNLYCHRDPHRWREVEEGWNYCLHDRRPGEVRVRSDGRLVSRFGTPIHVAHGNARSLRKLALTAT